MKGKTIDDVVVIGVEEGGLYKLKGHTDTTFTASTISPCKLWHRKLAHVNYKALPIMSKVVYQRSRLIMKGYAKDVLKERIPRTHFQEVRVKQRGSWILFTHMCVDRCQLLP